MAQRSFSQLKFHDRVQIEALKREGLSLRAIGRRLGKSASTISRELQRNKTVTTARQGAEWLAAQNLWWEEDIQAYLSRLTPQQRKTTSTWTAKLAQDKRDWRRWRACALPISSLGCRQTTRWLEPGPDCGPFSGHWPRVGFA